MDWGSIPDTLGNNNDDNHPTVATANVTLPAISYGNRVVVSCIWRRVHLGLVIQQGDGVTWSTRFGA